MGVRRSSLVVVQVISCWSMPLGKHQRTKGAVFRRERADSRVAELKKEYPELRKRNIHGNTKLGTLRDRYGVDSLNQVLMVLRQKKHL